MNTRLLLGLRLLDGLRQRYELLAERVRVRGRKPAVRRGGGRELKASQLTPARQLLEPLDAHKRLRLVPLEVLPAGQAQLAPLLVGRRRLELCGALLDPL